MWQFIINIKTLNKDETFTLQNKPEFSKISYDLYCQNIGFADSDFNSCQLLDDPISDVFRSDVYLLDFPACKLCSAIVLKFSKL